ncbi:BTAD domain-containing putative transcriptional regulator [Nocardioides guangzhouensis]|nr:BTAD domain-containing putative transcriptional regulator [Nocardioides guangzhouensis]
MGIALLGPLVVNDGAVRLGSRDRIVLTALAMHPGEVLSAERLADAVWPGIPPASWHKNLQGCVVRLRKALGPQSIVTSPGGYRLALPADAVDGQVFERAVERGRELLTLGSHELAAFTLRDALSLWRGPALVDLEEWEPGNQYAERLEELRREAEELWLEAALKAGHHREVLAEAQAMVRAAPLRERRWQLLALAQYQSGRQGEALRTLHRLRQVLVRELGLDPGPDLVAFEQAILRQEPGLLVEPARASPEERCPYRGLTPYDVTDAESFFGRDGDVAACLELLAAEGVLAVVGPSGSGKSSLVRAGVAAALERDGRSVVTIVPGAHPLERSSALPARRSRPATLVVDQCEEVFSLCHDAAEQRAFLDWLVEHARAAPVVVALRADRMGDVSGHPGFAKLVQRGLYVLAAMAPQDLEAAIEGPARQVGLIVEPGLVDLLVREVEGEPGALPMLSHVLQETWLRREGRTLTVAGYQASGGIRGAVAQSAEDVYGKVDEDERRALRDLLLRLVIPGLDGQPVRSRVPRRLVVGDPAHDHLIDLLVGTRLVTSDDGVVELAHEALARAWPRLGAWLQEDVDGQRILHHLTGAADAWNSLGRPDSELYRGTRLAKALEWRGRSGSVLTPDEAAFLDRAEAVALGEQRAARDRARAQARLIQRLRVALTGAVVFLALAAVAGAFAVVQKRSADDNAAGALRAATAAEARRAGARALVSEDTDESMLLAVAGVKLDDSPETRSSLLGALARRPGLIESTQLTGPHIISFDMSPDGRTVATYDKTNHVRLYATGTGRQLGEYQAGSKAQLSWWSGQASFSPDGDTLAVVIAAPARQPVMLLDVRTLKARRLQPEAPPRRRWQVNDLAWSRDGRHLAATLWRVRGKGATLRRTSPQAVVWDLDAPSRPTRIGLHEAVSVALSVDGRRLYTTAPSDPIEQLTIHDLPTGTSVGVHLAEPVEELTMSPNGRFLAGSDDAGLVLLDAETGDLRRHLRGAGESGWIPSFSPDGSRVATVTFNREAVAWDVATGELLDRFPLGEAGDVVDFGADRSTLYTAGGHSALRHWDLDGQRRFIRQVTVAPPELGGGEVGVQPAPGGKLIAYSNVSDEGTRTTAPTQSHVSFLDVDSGRVGTRLDRGHGYRPARGGGSWHPDGIHYALATGGEIRIWNAQSGRLTGMGRSSGPYVSAIDYSTDGSRLAMAELSGRVSMLDPTSLTPVGRSVELDEPVCCVSAGPDNHTALALTGPLDPAGFWAESITGWALVDLESGDVLDHDHVDMDLGRVAFSPDGRHAAIGGARSGRGEVLVLDTESGEPVRPPVVGHDGVVDSLAYSTDGERILTTGADGSVSLWNGETGLQLAHVATPQHPIAAEFGEGTDSVIIAPLWEGPVYEWDTSTDYAITFACRLAGRDFTKAEWEEHFPGRRYQETCPS